MKQPKIGDYVLATQYEDGSPLDHFAIGFLHRVLPRDASSGITLYLVSDGKGTMLGSFSRCERISDRVGQILVSNASFVEQGSASVWYWRRHAKTLERIANTQTSDRVE